jgi:hypothetical protein
MPATGYLRIHAYESYAQLPLQDVAVTVTASDGTAIAMALTDRNGAAGPIPVPVPDLKESLSPDPPERPYTAVNIYAHKRGYERIEAENLQLFADTTTLQPLEMVPLAELPDSWNQLVVFDTPPQNL